MFSDVVIAGCGDTDYHKDEQRHPLEYLSEAIGEAVADSCIPYSEVDGMAVISFDLPRDNAVSIGQHFGIDGPWYLGDEFGSASPIAGIIRGARAIQEEVADVVVVAAAGATSTEETLDLIDQWNTFIYNHLRPYGFGGANGIFALLQRRHMHEFGTTREQLSEVVVTQREHARSNPKALLRSPMDQETYLNARPIVEPLHLYDCVLQCGGGAACVLASKEIAAEYGSETVPILSGEEFHNPNLFDAFDPSLGWKHHDVVAKAGIKHDDIDTVQLYDNYAINVVIQLEDLGFCKKGDGGRFVTETDLSIGGDLALNTDGGHLSVGQAGGAGGLLGVVEAIRQLRGEAGERQVRDCEVALASGFGNVAYGGGLSSTAVVLGTVGSREVSS